MRFRKLNPRYYPCFSFWVFFPPNCCFHLSPSSLWHLLFPLLHLQSSYACSVWLCAPKPADMSLQAWVSETLMSVCQSLRYISRPLPCIIDCLSLITVSTVTDELLLPGGGLSPASKLKDAAPATTVLRIHTCRQENKEYIFFLSCHH